jgi:LPXTG-motif cell wall-anchored protein
MKTSLFNVVLLTLILSVSAMAQGNKVVESTDTTVSTTTTVVQPVLPPMTPLPTVAPTPTVKVEVLPNTGSDTTYGYVLLGVSLIFLGVYSKHLLTKYAE